MFVTFEIVSYVQGQRQNPLMYDIIYQDVNPQTHKQLYSDGRHTYRYISFIL